MLNIINRVVVSYGLRALKEGEDLSFWTSTPKGKAKSGIELLGGLRWILGRKSK